MNAMSANGHIGPGGKRRRVVITGMGAVTPLGHSVAATWAGLQAGKCGIDTISVFDASTFETRIGGEVRGFPFEQLAAPPALAEVLDRKNSFGFAAAHQAMVDAGLATPGAAPAPPPEDLVEPTRFGISLGTEGRRDHLLPELRSRK
ncbi:MAG: beta-ketoacyl synthase N-terminal-like domain-containing protein, partial [Terriglobales bacterium]